MMLPPYLKPESVFPFMSARPTSAFFVRPADYLILDGDTVMILAPREGKGKREEAFRVRMFAVNSPEKPVRSPTHKMMLELGIDMHASNPGRIATDFFRNATKGRVLLIEPRADGGRRNDSYGRLLANISISGTASNYFSPIGALSAEHHLYMNGHAVLLRDKRTPIPTTQLVLDLRTHVEMSGPKF